jgi:hypothetical protein
VPARSPTNLTAAGHGIEKKRRIQVIKKRIPAHTVEIRKYVCLGCGLGMECGNPGSEKTHRYVMGHGNEWDCGPVVEIPNMPKFVRVRDAIAGLTTGRWYRYALNSKGERMRKLERVFSKWENVEKMLYKREHLHDSEHVCSTGECYPICKKTEKNQ